VTTKEVKDRLVEIALIAGDNETAHAMEDALHLEVLREIAKSTCRNRQALAREAAKSRLIKFDRWYA